MTLVSARDGKSSGVSYGAIAGLALVAIGVWGGYRAVTGGADTAFDSRSLRDFSARVGRGVVHHTRSAGFLEGGVGDQMHLVSVVPDEMLQLADVLALAEQRASSLPAASARDAGVGPGPDAGAPLAAILREAKLRLGVAGAGPGEKIVDVEALAPEGQPKQRQSPAADSSPVPSVPGEVGAATSSGGADPGESEPPAASGGAGADLGAAGAAARRPEKSDFDPDAPVPKVRISYQSTSAAFRSGATWLLGKPAPEIAPQAWTEGTHPKLSIAANRGKVFVIYAFQGWCPACQARGFPVTKVLEALYEGRDVEFLYLQTPFEAPTINDFARLLVEKINWQIERVMAQDGHTQGVPTTMRLYRTGGTPWHIVIDRYGIVRYSDFTRSADFFQRLIDALLEY